MVPDLPLHLPVVHAFGECRRISFAGFLFMHLNFSAVSADWQ
jgi:hypothetical protein